MCVCFGFVNQILICDIDANICLVIIIFIFIYDYMKNISMFCYLLLFYCTQLVLFLVCYAISAYFDCKFATSCDQSMCCRDESE